MDNPDLFVLHAFHTAPLFLTRLSTELKDYMNVFSDAGEIVAIELIHLLYLSIEIRPCDLISLFVSFWLTRLQQK